jgi:hypothetical protein
MDRRYQTQKFKQEVQGRIVIWIPCEIGLILSSTFRAVFDHIFSNLALTIFHAPSRRRRSRTVRNSFFSSQKWWKYWKSHIFSTIECQNVVQTLGTAWHAHTVGCIWTDEIDCVQTKLHQIKHFSLPFHVSWCRWKSRTVFNSHSCQKNGIAITLNKKHLKSQLVRNVQDDIVSLYVAQVPKKLRSIWLSWRIAKFSFFLVIVLWRRQVSRIFCNSLRPCGGRWIFWSCVT